MCFILNRVECCIVKEMALNIVTQKSLVYFEIF